MRGVAGVLLLLAILILPACAEQTPPMMLVQSQPVAAVQPQDTAMDCPAIFAELQANLLKISDLADEDGFKGLQDRRGGIGGNSRRPPWSSPDALGRDKEIRALQMRGDYLLILAKQRQCGQPAAKS